MKINKIKGRSFKRINKQLSNDFKLSLSFIILSTKNK